MKTVLFVCVHNSGRSQMAEASSISWLRERHKHILQELSLLKGQSGGC